MAKRTRLNKRMVIFLVSLGVVGLIVLSAVLVTRLPKDEQKKRDVAEKAMKDGNLELAVKNYGELIAIAKDRPDDQAKYTYELAKVNWEYYRGSTKLTDLEKGEKINNAIALLNKALTIRKSYVEAQRLLCEIYWTTNRPAEEYIKAATSLIALAPDDAETYFRRAVKHASIARAVQVGDHVQLAIDDFRKAISLKKDKPEYWVGLAVFTDAIKLPETDSMNQPEAVLREGIKANPNSAEMYLAFAVWQQQHANPAEAEELIENAVKMAPNDVRGYIARAQLRMSERKPDKAIEDLERAKDVDPADPRVYQILSQIYLRQSDLTRAAQCVREGIDKLSKMATTQSTDRAKALLVARVELDSLLGNILLDEIAGKNTVKKESRDEVQSLLDQITELAPESAARFKLAGRLALYSIKSPSTVDSSKLAEAIKNLEEADKRSHQSDGQTVYELIRSYIIAGKPGMAEGIINRVLSVPGNEHNTVFKKFKVKLYRDFYHQYKKALELAEDVLNDDKDDTEARDMRDALKVIVGGQSGSVLPNNISMTPENLRLFQEQAENVWPTDHNGAIKLLEELHQKAPDNLSVSLQLMNCYANSEHQDDALKLMDTLIADAKDPKAKAEFQEMREQLLIKDPQERLQKSYSKALALAERETDPLKKTLSQAGVAAAYNQAEDYVNYLNKAAEINPNDKIVVARKFELDLSNGKWSDAETWADKAAKADLDGAKGMMYRARLAAAQQHFPAAIKMLEDINNEHPDAQQVQILLAGVYRLNGNLDKAEELYTAMYKNNQGYLPALLGLIMVTDRPDRYDDHRQYVEQAYALAPNNSFVVENMLVLEEINGKPEDVIAKRLKIYRQNPRDIRNVYHLADLYERTRQIDRAEQMYAQAFAIAADKVTSGRILAQFYLRTNRFGSIRKIMEQLLSDKVDPVGVHVMYGDFLTTQDKAQANGEYQKAVQANPRDPRGYLAMANFAASLGQWSDAVNNMMEVFRLDPSRQGQREEKILVLYQLNAKQFDNARARIDSMLARRPSDFEAQALMARLAMMKDLPAKAEEALTTAINLNNTNAIPLMNRADFYVEQDELNKAQNDLEAAQKIAPANTDVSYRLAMVYERQIQNDKAIMQFRDILSRNHEHRAALQELVTLYVRQKKFTELEDLLAGYLKKNQNNAPILVLRARVLQAQDRHEEALKCLEDAVKKAPDSQDILRLYLVTLIEEKRYAAALAKTRELMDNTNYEWVAAIHARALVGANRSAEADKLFARLYEKSKGQFFDFMMEQALKAYSEKDILPRLIEWTKTRPNDLRALYYLGNVAASAGDFALAEDTFNKALTVAKDPVDKLQITSQLGQEYYHRHMLNRSEKEYLSKAEKAFLEILKSDPREVHALNNLAYLYVDDMNDPDKALPYAQLAAKKQPDSDVLDTYGWVLARKAALQSNEQEKRDLYEQAAKRLVRSVELSETVANRYHLAWVYEQMGRTQDAKKLYAQVWEILRGKRDDPLYGPVKQAIDRLGL